MIEPEKTKENDAPEKIASDIFRDPKTQQAAIPAHQHTGADALKVNFADLSNKRRYVLYRALDATASTSVTSTLGGDLVMPFAGFVTMDVGATVDTAGVTGTMTVDIKLNGATIMANTKITILTTTKTSRSATNQPIVTTTAFKKGDIFTFDITVVQTTPAKGLTVFMAVVEV